LQQREVIMGIINRLFGRQSSAPPLRPSQFGVPLDSKIPEASSTDLTRRELVRVALRDLRRAHGIPAPWLDCEVLAVRSRSGASHIFVRILVLQWDERLLKYALAFQRHLGVEITRLDPRATEWLQGMAWEFAPSATASCPHLKMPKPASWAPSTPLQPAASVDVLDRRASRREGNISQRQPLGPRDAVAKARRDEEDFPETRQGGF